MAKPVIALENKIERASNRRTEAAVDLSVIY